MSTGRHPHHPPEAGASAPPATAQERMAATVRTPAGRALYARRKVIVEPVFGQSKAARGFRRFLLRGLANSRGAWRLVGLTPNLRKMGRDGGVVHAVSAVRRPVYGRERAPVRALWRSGAALALPTAGAVEGSDPSERAIDRPNKDSKSRFSNSRTAS